MASPDGLARLVADSPQISALPWTDEGDRWAELLFCALYQLRKANPLGTRQAVHVILGLGLGRPDRLASLSQHEASAIGLALSNSGWPSNQIVPAIDLLAALAGRVKSKGKVQRLLREAAESLRDTLEKAFASPAISEAKLRSIIGHWLQNVCNLPLVIADEDLNELASQLGMTVSQLYEAADEIDLNFCALDDLAMAKKAAARADE